MIPTPEQVRAEPAGRRLDAWVAEYVCGLKPWKTSGGVWYLNDSWIMTLANYSTDWSAAGPLLESFSELYHVVIDMALAEIRVTTGVVLSICGKWEKEIITVGFWRPTPNDLCRAIAIARLLVALGQKK